MFMAKLSGKVLCVCAPHGWSCFNPTTCRQNIDVNAELLGRACKTHNRTCVIDLKVT